MQKTYHYINRIVTALLVGIFGLLVVDVLWQVFGRYVLGQSFSFTEELARFALIWLAILGAAYLN
ncbi:MAG: TRAP transporter small permease subunit, partial [Bacteroidota bacterium]